ncbi:MAG: DUF3800 domain-containing protein [Pseudomonadota bacterium]|nr:DUF3800 domain-containing protein [Pseudomonadota bacterium]
MNIYIDESGSFVNASTTGKWNAVAAVAAPEAARRKIDQLVQRIRLRPGSSASAEVKLHELSEDSYLHFLAALAPLNVAVFCTATDAGLNTTDRVCRHQREQVAQIRKNLDKMRHEGGRLGVELMATQLENLSPQLYVQLVCQIYLMFDVIARSINYFAQRVPGALREFRWRVDQKNSSRTAFEDAFEKLSPALLQTMSFTEPFMKVDGFDYSRMKQYEFIDGKAPAYLRQDYAIKADKAFNIQKMIRGNIRFVDSKVVPGIQAADLVVSGIRRCLRRQFVNNEAVAAELGKLMLQARHDAPSLKLVSFGDEVALDKSTADVVRLMSTKSKRMVK